MSTANFDRSYKGTVWRSKDPRDNGRMVIVFEVHPRRNAYGIYLELHNTATHRKSYIAPRELLKRYTEVRSRYTVTEAQNHA